MDRLITVGLGFAIGLSLAGVAAADPYSDASAAWQRGDYASAIRVIRPAAERGSADAEYWMGLAYDSGRGAPLNYSEAARWYRLAAEQGELGAEQNLGLAYAMGKGLPQNYGEAVKWFRKTAARGEPLGQSALGFAFGRGDGVPRDFVQAYMWLTLAISRLQTTQSDQRATVLKFRAGLAAKMSPAEIASAERLARSWVPSPVTR